MLVYLGTYTGLALSALGLPRQAAIFFFLISSVFLVWFMGFRYETGCDYHAYLLRWITFSPPTSLSQVFQGEEAGFALLVWSVKAIGLDYTWLNVAASIILVFCYVKFASAHRFAPLVLALLFPVIIVQLGMSGIRQALAGGFLMLAFNAFIRRQKLWTAIWVLIGMQFHASVVMFLPLALLAGRDVSMERLAVSLAVLGPVASLLLANRFDTNHERYIEQVHGAIISGGAVIRYALVALPVPFFFLYQKKLKAFFPEVYPLLKLMSLLIISLSPLVFISSIALHRINFYIMPGSILLCVYVGALISEKYIKGHWITVIAYGSYSFFWFLLSRHAELCYVPYENTWFL